MTLKFEGEYSADQLDPGGETYRGISRKNNPNWPGWRIIDRANTSHDFPRNLRDQETLNNKLEELYRENYWNRLAGESLPDQQIATLLFDSAVNLGVWRTTKHLQKTLNILNQENNTLIEDGSLGPKTISALDNITTGERRDNLVETLHILRGKHYLDIVSKRPELTKYFCGWLNRLSALRSL